MIIIVKPAEKELTSPRLPFLWYRLNPQQHVYISVISPALDDDDASIAQMEPVAHLSFIRNEGLVGKVWARRLAVSEDRAGITKDELKARFTPDQYKAVRRLRSLIAFPIEGPPDPKAKPPQKRGVVVGVLCISSIKPMSKTKLREFQEEYWPLAHLIQRILVSPPV